MTPTTHRTRNGISLAKGPVALIGLAMLAYGIGAFIFGGHSFAAHPISGDVNGKTWLGLEVNAWSSLLFVAGGALLLFGSPAHWAAKTMSMIVGLVLLAAAAIASYDKTDVLGIFAANNVTKIVWAAAGALLVLLSLLPRVGRRDDEREARRREPAATAGREPDARFTRERPGTQAPVGRREGATSGRRREDGGA